MKRHLFSLLLLIGISAAGFAHAEEMPNGQKGVVTGVLVDKGQHWIEVRASGGGVKRYIPFGGKPEDEKDYDRAIVDQIRQIPIDSRVELNWEFQRYFRIAKIRTLPKPIGG